MVDGTSIYMQTNKTIHELVREQEKNYTTGNTKLSKYVDFDMYETINTIEAYLNSKHTSGSTDSLGREKPFFNIVTAAVNIWYRATDIDRKNIRVKATRSAHVMPAFLATQHLQSWMKKVNFGTFLNSWGRTLAQYGSAVVKFVEKDGVLYPAVVPWNRLIVDPVSFDGTAHIEKLYYTPAQLLKHPSYDKKVVSALLASQAQRSDLHGEKKDNRSEFIEVYEVHGEMPKSYLTGNDRDDDVYTQQMHVVSFVGTGKGGHEDFTLYKGKEAKDPYMITHLIEEDGRTMAIGAVEHLFDAQWMQNHSIKAMKDQLDLASKLIFQTADQSFIGRNALTAIENGDILVHKENAPLSQINNGSHDLTSLKMFSDQWGSLAQQITSTPDAIRGNTQPSGTAYRLQALLTEESHSLFEIMTENKGLALEEMLRRHVIPHLKKKMDTTEELVATLENHDIRRIDSVYIPNEAIRRMNAKFVDSVVRGEVATPIDPAQAQQEVQTELAQLGNQRFFKPSDIEEKTWNEALEDLEWELEVEITSETTDKQAVFESLNTVLQTLASNPGILQDPNAKLVFGRILEETGKISPLELSTVSNNPAPSQGQPQMAAPVGGAGGQLPVIK